MSSLAVILARAGSKGLPLKNQRPVAGKPCLQWTLEHAFNTPSVDRVLLSTDGNELAEIGRAAGAEVVMRPYEFAHDTAAVDGAVRHAVTSIISSHSRVLILYGNVPVRPDDLSERALQKLTDTGCDSVQSLCPSGKNHPYWMKSLAGEDSDQLEDWEPNTIYRRQDLPPVYQLDGGVIAVTRESLFAIDPAQPHAFLGTDRRAILTQPGEVVDIDGPADLIVAEATLKLQREEADRKAKSVRAVG
ncbi:MAG: acylneuraminate cytidylyltransferase family protein [Algisphaera sp.]